MNKVINKIIELTTPPNNSNDNLEEIIKLIDKSQLSDAHPSDPKFVDITKYKRGSIKTLPYPKEG